MDLPRGMRDIWEDDFAGIEAVREGFMRTAELFSFRLVDPSPIESLSTLEAKSGPAIREEVYHFEDKGGRDVALRFDFTVGLTRHVAASRSMAMPAALASFGGVFRYDEPQRGRYRFFHQWNVEVFGPPTVESEAEVIEFASSLYGSLGLDGIRIEVSHRGLAEAFVRDEYPWSGEGEEARARVLADSLRLVDKSAKRPRAALLEEYSHMPGGYAESLLDFASVRGSPDDAAAAVPSASGPWGRVRELWDALRSRSVGGVEVNLGIVRGLDYYSGAVFEAIDPGSGEGALAGGGRYDALAAALGRPDLGAAGAAGGVERTALAMSRRGRAAPLAARRRESVSVLHTGGGAQRAAAAALASGLRAAGVPARIDLAGRPLRKQMAAAASWGSGISITVGPRETERNAATVRRMDDGSETEVGMPALLGDPRGALGLRGGGGPG